MIDRLAEFFGANTKIASLTTGDVLEFVQERLKSAAPTSIALEINVLRKIFEIAIEAGLINTNPAVGVKAPSQRRLAPNFITAAEYARILEACPEWLRPVVEFSTSTGLTQSEILKLRWADVKEHKHKTEWSLDVRGGRKVRTIFLNKTARAVLTQMRDGSPPCNELVFRGKSLNTSNISQTFLRSCRSAGVQNFSFHQLRYTAAKWLRESGAGLDAIAQYLGHRSLRMAERLSLPNAESIAHDTSVIDRYLGHPRSHK